MEAYEGNNFVAIVLRKMFIAQVEELNLPQLEEEYPYDNLTDDKGKVVVSKLFLELSRLYTGDDEADVLNRMQDYLDIEEDEISDPELEEERIERALQNREHDLRERRRLALQNIGNVINADNRKSKAADNAEGHGIDFENKISKGGDLSTVASKSRRQKKLLLSLLALSS